jgi:hypothetical protein
LAPKAGVSTNSEFTMGFTRDVKSIGEDISEFRLFLSTIISAMLSPLGFNPTLLMHPSTPLFNQFRTMGK